MENELIKCELALRKQARMLKWLIAFALALLVFDGLRRRRGRLPGDIDWRWRGHHYRLPLGSLLLLSLFLSLLLRRL
jgi:hypothetical protein